VDFYSITQWLYPIMELTVSVMCFTMLRCSGGILLGIAFLIMALTSLSWPLIDLFSSADLNDMYYDISSYVAFILYLTSTILIIIGVVNLSATMRKAN